jgi:isoleucyl-tRNA synthetase
MARFEKVETQVDFPAREREILRWWEESRVFDKLREKNKGGPKWSFLDGPITANNPMGVHHAWGRTYKDIFNRYRAMTGCEQRYQNGFDCQGLWVEVEVEKELGLKTKRDIEQLVPGDRTASIARFVQLCKDRVNKFARVQTEQSIRLGYWMDWDRTDADWSRDPGDRKSYFTMSAENNDTIWAFLKKCHERGLIYRGYDAMPWCGRCGVGISEQEKAEGYKLIEHRAVFVRFPLKGRPGESLLAWTTTPWTLTSNVAAAVNPELTYLKVRLKGEAYYVAKDAFTYNRMESGSADDESGAGPAKKVKRDWLAGVPHLKTIEQHFKEKAGKDGFTIESELRGQDMIGWEYFGPFDGVDAQRHEYGYPAETAAVVRDRQWAPAVSAVESHRVIPWTDVGSTEGTGIVHIAPGCGQEDFALGKANGLPPVAPLDESGDFLAGFGPLTGRNAADPAVADAVFEHLKANGLLFAIERYVHKYPHCWRCKTELLYRLVDEWFIDMKWRSEIAEVVEKVTFLPASINGKARELDWLRNMGDWMISKKRFWGLALPIWVDDVTGEFEVIGSRAELKARAVEGWDQLEGQSPHRPYVDAVKIRNPKTGNLMSRIPDVGNPWLDAGIVAFSTLRWNTDREYWRKWYPADFITESFPGQFRNWFYALLAMSTMMSDGEPPFRVLLGHGLVRDEHGREMHKSLGNSIPFDEAADRMGADVCRWLYARHNPAQNLNFGYGPADEVRARFVLKLWNTYAFFVNYARLDGFDVDVPPVPFNDRGDLDRWILSDLQLLVDKARDSFEQYDVMSFCLAVESFVDDRLSNWYVRRSRKRFWAKSADLDDAGQRDKLAAYQTLYSVLTTLAKLIAPVVPFLAEAMWQNLLPPDARRFGGVTSVHLEDFPVADVAMIDRDLSDDMQQLFRLVTMGSAARNAVKIKVRQPLAELRVHGGEAERRCLERFAEQLQEELNVKKVVWSPEPFLCPVARLNKKTAAPKLGGKLRQAEAELAGIDAGRLAGPLELAGVALDEADVIVEYHAAEGWAGVADRGAQVAIDSRLTDELKGEGLAREIIRHVQEARKSAGMELEDKIAVHVARGAAPLTSAIDRHRAAIATEAQIVRWLDAPPAGAAEHTAKIDGNEFAFSLTKA